MKNKRKSFADDGWALWIDGDDVSTVYLNDWLNPQGHSFVDIAIRIRGETVATRECRWPIEECCAAIIKDTTRRSLYRLKYRDMMQVINDFKNGQLQRLCSDELSIHYDAALF